MEDRKRFCKKCGEPLKENARFCAKCSEPVGVKYSIPDLVGQSGNDATQNKKVADEGVAQVDRKNRSNKGSKKKIIIALLSLVAICVIAAGIFAIAGDTGNKTLDVGEYTANPSGLDVYLSKNNYTKDSDRVYESPDKQVRVELDERGVPKQILIAGGDTTIFGIGIGDTFYTNTIGKKLTSRGYGLSDEDDMSITYSTEFPGGVKGVRLFVKMDTQKIYNIIYYMEVDSDEFKADESLQESASAETFETQEGNTQESNGMFKTGIIYGTYECHEENLDATAVISWSQEEQTDSIYLSGSSSDGMGMGEFIGQVISSKENNYTAMNTDGNIINFYYNGIDKIEIGDDDNFNSYGLYFPGFNGVYNKTEEISSVVGVKAPDELSARVIPVETVFSDETDECSWKSDSTGYYMIPFYDSDTDTYNVWFTVANNRIWENTVYTVTVSEMERTSNGGITCRGKMIFANELYYEENGTVEITWDSLETVDFPTIKMIDGTEFTEVDMIAQDYGYYGLCN